MRRLLLIGASALPDGALLTLDANGYDRCIAASATEALESFGAASPDVIVAAPPASAREAAALAAIGRLAPVIVAAEEDTLDHRIEALEGGAEDVLHRNMHAREAALRIARAEERWRRARARNRLTFGSFTLDIRRQTLHRPGFGEVELSESETRFTELLASRRGGLVTRLEIARLCLRSTFREHSRSTDMLAAKLRRRFRELGAKRAIASIRGEGYCLWSCDGD